ncbi:MAG: hypothetical protein M3544_13525 [Pseudomonadota bacterium]|nr:hypothetical protein [Pseudomonadota bacterium]
MATRSHKRALLCLAFCAALAAAVPSFAQSGLRLPERGELGLDPTFARGWLAPDYDQFGFATYPWRDTLGFAPGQRMHWSYSFSRRGSLGMAYGDGRYLEQEQRQLSVFGRYWLSPDWALSAETMSRDPSGLFRLQDLRIGVQRRF